MTFSALDLSRYQAQPLEIPYLKTHGTLKIKHL
jgi:hypothetical protein